MIGWGKRLGILEYVFKVPDVSGEVSKRSFIDDAFDSGIRREVMTDGIDLVVWYTGAMYFDRNTLSCTRF